MSEFRACGECRHSQESGLFVTSGLVCCNLKVYGESGPKRDVDTGKWIPEFCRDLNKHGNCPHFEAKPPPWWKRIFRLRSEPAHAE